MNDPSQISGAELPEMPKAAVFTPGSSELPAPLAVDAAEPGPILLLVNAAQDPIWAADSAIAIASSWARAGRRVVLADLHFEEPILHTRLGESNLDGVVDIFLYGASVARSARPPRDHGFFLIPAGTYTATPEDVYGHPRWNKLVAGFREAGATLLAFVPAAAAGVDRLSQYSAGAVLLGRAPSAAAQGLGLESVRAVLVSSVADLEPEAPAADDQPADEVEAEPSEHREFAELDLPGGVAVFGAPEAEPELDTPELEQGSPSPGWHDDFTSEERVDEASTSLDADAERGETRYADEAATPVEAFAEDAPPSVFSAAPAEDFAPAHEGEAQEITEDEPAADAADAWAHERRDWSLEPTEAEPVELDDADSFTRSSAEFDALPEREEHDHEPLALGAEEHPFPADASGRGAQELPDADALEVTDLEAEDEVSAEPLAFEAEPGKVDDETGVRLAPPAPQPLISPSRRKRRSGPGPMIWLLVGAATLVLAVLVAAMLRPDLFGGVRGPGGGNPAQDSLGARVPPAPLTPVPVGDTLAYTVQVRAYASLPPAQTQLERQARRVAETQFYIVPELTQGVLYYKVMAGTLRDTAAGTALRQRLVEAGVIAAADARDDAFGSWSLIQARPLTYQLGEFATQDEAVARAESLSETGIPSYTLALPYSDGTQRWRVYGGAYADSVQAAEFGRLLREADLPVRLVTRLGREVAPMP